ncbi:hypothetical protein [Pedobacter paludis]|uniref:Uncharacterized protein n=1 Tax=Pedobacter paludis TaxID=2203212 RepID=A0A317F3Y4_9SPHI|nr:hypothetical protein [Pedobacter paludis]PWS32196.1 hypothetical protein DF947_10530 [Pedobacter paludis]
MKESEARVLPEILIEGISFLVDAYLGELRDAGDPRNRIRLADMQNFADRSEFYFDRKKGTAASLPYPMDADVTHVVIRPLPALDPKGMDQLVGYPNQYSQTYFGQLPVIELHGTEFYVDPIKNGFRECTNVWNTIGFDKIDKALGGFYYDRNAKNVPFEEEMRNYKADKMPHISFTAVPSNESLARMVKKKTLFVSSNLKTIELNKRIRSGRKL